MGLVGWAGGGGILNASVSGLGPWRMRPAHAPRDHRYFWRASVRTSVGYYTCEKQ